MSELIKLGGRTYALCQQTTVRQDGWVQGLMSQAGVTVLHLQMRAGETALDFANRITRQTVESGLATKIIAGMLYDVEAPLIGPWQPAYAEAIAERLDNITEPADKERFQAQLASLVAGFFASAMRQRLLSLKSSVPAPAPGPEVLPRSETAESNPITSNVAH